MAGGRSMGQITPGVVLSKVAVYAVGLLFMAFGVAFSVNSGLGVSPVNSLPYVVSLVLGVDMGSCVIAVPSITSVMPARLVSSWRMIGSSSRMR